MDPAGPCRRGCCLGARALLAGALRRPHFASPISAARGRLASALGASVLFVPLWLNAVWTWTNQRAAVWAGVVLLNVLLTFLASRRRPDQPPAQTGPRLTRALLTLLIAYVAGCVFCFYWTPTALGRVASSPSGDYIKHHAVLWSLASHPLPLHNLFFSAAADAPYYYYHYHYLLPSAIRRLAGDRISLAMAFGLTSALVAALFIALVFLIAQKFLRPTRVHFSPRSASAWWADGTSCPY